MMKAEVRDIKDIDFNEWVGKSFTLPHYRYQKLCLLYPPRLFQRICCKALTKVNGTISG
jgi:hypothetical protein